MSDLISRQAAIEALDKRFDNVPMEQTAMIYAHVFVYSRDADIAFKEFIAEHNPTRMRRFGNALSAAFIDEDEHWFMGVATYPRWAMGRTYIDVGDGKLYRSGYRL